MKRIFTLCLIFSGLLFASCKEEVVIEPAAPVATFAIEDEVMDIYLGDKVSFAAEVECPCDFVCGWYVDGIQVSNIERVTYVFNEKGSFSVHFEAENELGKVEKDYTVNVTGMALEVEYSNTDSEINIDINDVVTLSVNVIAGDKNTVHEWKVDDEVVSKTTDFEYAFNKDGQFVISYKGVNADGESASRQWTVKVKDLPLDIVFSVPGNTINSSIYRAVAVSTKVNSGLSGLTHCWTLDGNQISTEGSISYLIETEGTYTLAYKAENAVGEKVEKSWTVNITESLIFDDFEGSTGVSSYYIGNNPNGVNAIAVAENPYKTATNPSAQVLVDEASKITWASSGYFKFKINTYPDGSQLSSTIRSGFTKLRVKIYLGNTGFCPFLQEDAKSTKSLPSEINGKAFDCVNPSQSAWDALVKTDDWNIFVYDLTSGKYSPDVPAFGSVEQLQFRVTVNLTNSSQAGQDVYFDDIEFIK